MRRAETFIINLAFCLLVLGPVAALSYLTQIWLKLVVIAVAIMFASVVASGLSDNGHKGSLAVIAGYVASMRSVRADASSGTPQYSLSFLEIVFNDGFNKSCITGHEAPLFVASAGRSNDSVSNLRFFHICNVGLVPL